MRRLSQNEFLSKIMSVHGNEKYDFSLAVYRNNRSQVLILCHKHGAFNIKAEVFMQGHGCKTYGDIYRHTMSRERLK
jgi:hypothetical protein